MTAVRNTSIITASAVAIGVAADYLVRAPDWGINVPIAALLVAVAGLVVTAGNRHESPPWPWLASIFFAAMWAVRGGEQLLAVDFLAAIALACLPLLQAAGVSARATGLIDLFLLPLRTVRTMTLEAFDFAQVARAGRVTGEISGSRARAVGVGALLAIPLILLFGALFASADPVFNHTISTVLGRNIGRLISHAVTAAAFAWATAGYLWFLTKRASDAKSSPSLPVLGGIQVLTPLVAIVVLFAFFVAVQVTSLFGGAAFVETTTGLTFAAYARQGFFQLIFASMLVLPLVYFAPQAAGSLDQRAMTWLRILLAGQLALTALVLASALWRLLLYVRMYGLTEDRVNGVAVMLWIAGTLGVFAATVVRGRPRGAVFGSLLAAVITLAALNLANPQAFIARYNLAHQNGREIDFEHLARLGGDAVPILAAQIDVVPAASRCRVITAVRSRDATIETDWRAWNWARMRAHEAALRLQPAEPCSMEPAPEPRSDAP
jgi:hypothetical protein